MPDITVASGDSFDGGVTVINSQVQGIHLSAAVGVRVSKCVVAASGICSAVPDITFAFSNNSGRMYRIIDSQMKSDSAIATSNVGVNVRRCISAIRVICVPPRVVIAGYSRGITSGTVINSEVQGIHLSAVVGVRVSRCVVAASGICSAVPDITFAFSNNSGRMYRIIDSQVQGDSAVAAPLVGTGKEVCQNIGAFSDICVLIPREAVAGDSHGIAGAAVIDSKQKRVCAEMVFTAFRVCGFVPSSAVAHGECCGGAVVDSQLECCHAVATCGVEACECRSVSAFVVLHTMPDKAVASGDSFDGEITTIDGKMESIHLCAAVCIGVSIGVVTAGGVYSCIPSEAVASCFSSS